MTCSTTFQPACCVNARDTDSSLEHQHFEELEHFESECVDELSEGGAHVHDALLDHLRVRELGLETAVEVVEDGGVLEVHLLKESLGDDAELVSDGTKDGLRNRQQVSLL